MILYLDEKLNNNFTLTNENKPPITIYKIRVTNEFWIEITTCLKTLTREAWLAMKGKNELSLQEFWPIIAEKNLKDVTH